MKKLLASAFVFFCLPAVAQPPRHFDGHSWRSQVEVLAADNMEGRETGSAGLRRAQEYVIEQAKKNGLQPAGSNGFYQAVKFVSRELVEKDTSVALVRDGKEEPLAIGDDLVVSTRVALAGEVKAPLVFAGYGMRVPEKNYDDFSGLDVRGKIIVVLNGFPDEIPGPLASHYQSVSERWKLLRSLGVIGMVNVPNPAFMDIPWPRIAANRHVPSMSLVGEEFNDAAGAQFGAYFNPARADLLLAGSGHTFAELAALGKDRKALPHFRLSVSLHSRTRVTEQPVESANLVALLPGTDPVLKDEYVVLTAHLDHLGFGAPVNGDKLYNGAMDNGSGSALLLDLAASLKKSPEKLRRSVLFIWVCGEEKGLLGSRYFAAHPTVPAEEIIADLNTDMFMPIVPLTILRVQGLDESDLGDRARAAAKVYGVRVQSDPEPQQNHFIRSDQYNFIRRGIPAVAMTVGFDPGSPEQVKFKAWITEHYHAPSDDLSQPVDLASAALYEDIFRSMVVAVANANHRPEWKSESFFRRYARN
jgi:Zn-dependent M28 family amino/carboxypeptidase